ncbi:MAG: DUF3280 domain-containing protein [Hyphomicrobium sp.]
MISRNTSSITRILKGIAAACLMVPALIAVSGGVSVAEPVSASKPVTVVFLGIEFINDNEGYEPTSDAERARLKNVEDTFITRLGGSGQYSFLPLSAEVRAQVAKGQSIGECGGCEIEFGKQLKAERVAWIRVQKVSNLILNMNVYMADVATAKMTFVRSVDMRGNADETWTKSINWLIKNYILPSTS